MASSRIYFPVLSLVLLLSAFADAKEILVGGKESSWTLDSSKSLSDWAAKKRFRIGDVLKWKSEKGGDSVLLVTEEDYTSCDTASPIKGDVQEITLDRSGKFFFISGVEDHCGKGLKLIVAVMSSHSHEHGAASSPGPAAAAPAPSPSNAAPHGFSLSGGFIGMGLAGLVGMALI